MINLADAGGRIMYSYKELSELAGFTSRVYNLVRVLQDLSEDRYVSLGPGGTMYTIEDVQGERKTGCDGNGFYFSPSKEV